MSAKLMLEHALEARGVWVHVGFRGFEYYVLG